MEIRSLKDLDKLRTAPILQKYQCESLLEELNSKIKICDWLTIGIMAPSDHEAKDALKSLIKKYAFNNFMNFDTLNADGSIFLKANQKTGEVYIRSENGLGVGILLTCQYDDKSRDSTTYGPFPLTFFIPQ